MKIKSTGFLLFAALAFWEGAAADENKRAVYAEWDAAQAEFVSGKPNPRRLETAAEELRALARPKHWENEQERSRFDLIDFTISKSWLNAGDHQKSLAYLKAEVAHHQISGSQFLQSTRNPEAFAREVFVHHSEIIAGTGNEQSIQGAGYHVIRVSGGDKFHQLAFVYPPAGTEENGIIVQGLLDHEERQTICLTGADSSGKCRVLDRAVVIAERGRFAASAKQADGKTSLALGGITKVIEFIGEFGAPVVRPSPRRELELLVSKGKIEQPVAALARLGIASEVDPALLNESQPEPGESRSSEVDGDRWRKQV